MMMRQSFILSFLSVILLCFVTLVEGNTVRCSFDNGRCHWKEANGKHCWSVSQSGQSLAGMTNYLYFNNSCSTSSEIKTKPDSGIILLNEEELHFWYYMYGEGEGELSIAYHTSTESIFGTPPEVSFHCGTDLGNQWHHAHVKISGTTTYVGITANATGSFLIAISNITADSHGGVVPKTQSCSPTSDTDRGTTGVTPKTGVTSTATREQTTYSRSEKNSLAGVCVFFLVCLCTGIL